MSDETVMDMSLDTQTSLPGNFTCDCQMLILSQYLTKLPIRFLYENRYVKILDMSKCINITIIPYEFCEKSHIEHIIWPPNIKIIHSFCLFDNMCIKKIYLLNCIQLMFIGDTFCYNTNIVDIVLPISIQNISFDFCTNNKALINLDLSHCINLTRIGSCFCANTNIQTIKFPKSLQKIESSICYNSNVRELDFSECKDIKIDTFMMCKVKALKIYSIDNIDIHIVECKDLYIYNITETKYLNLSFIENLQNVYLPEGEYCITSIGSNLYLYLNTKFWIHSSEFKAEYFSELRWYSYIPVHDLAELDTLLETI
jgi:hypothetical protein